MTNQRPKEHDYASHVSYGRALEDYCDALEKRTEAPLPEPQSELYWAARTEHAAAAFMLPGSKKL